MHLDCTVHILMYLSCIIDTLAHLLPNVRICMLRSFACVHLSLDFSLNAAHWRAKGGLGDYRFGKYRTKVMKTHAK